MNIKLKLLLYSAIISVRFSVNTFLTRYFKSKITDEFSYFAIAYIYFKMIKFKKKFYLKIGKFREMSILNKNFGYDPALR